MTARSPASEGIRACRSFAELLQSIAVPCLLLDHAGTVQLRNRAATALRQPFWPSAPPENWAELRDGIPALPETASIPPQIEHPGRQIIAGRLQDEATGTPCYLLQSPIDETERAMQLATAAHDIRTDLQTIIAASELLTQSGPSAGADSRPLQDSIAASAAHALELINASLDLSRLEFLQNDQPKDRFRVAAVVKAAAERLAPLAQKKRLTFRIEVPQETNLIEGQIHPIVTITQNLLSNAIKFTPEGEVCLSLTETPSQTGGRCDYCLTIEDTGDGFHGAARDVLLAPFQTGSHHTTYQTGTGIGTYLVQKATAALNGQLDITTPAKGGTRFSLLFSLPLSEEQPADAATDSLAGAAEPDLAGLRILIVDDNATNRDLFLRALQQAGARADGVANGQDALVSLTADGVPYDLVLLDLTMPGMDGIALATTLLLSPPPRLTPRLAALTGHNDDHTRAACRVLGMDNIIEKPIRPAELRRKIAALTTEPAPVSPLPAEPLNQALVSELIEDMGNDTARSLMQRALNEASDLFGALVRSGITQERRNSIHSALGSSGLTGLARVEFALRVIQAVSRIREQDSTAVTAALELLHRSLLETQKCLSAWPPAPAR